MRGFLPMRACEAHGAGGVARHACEKEPLCLRLYQGDSIHMCATRACVNSRMHSREHCRARGYLGKTVNREAGPPLRLAGTESRRTVEAWRKALLRCRFGYMASNDVSTTFAKGTSTTTAKSSARCALI